MPLKDYQRKRDFSRTREPRGGAGRRRNAHHPRFIVHKHDARQLHYDFRLELGGVLKSWAVPKGPSLDPDEKRLAVQVEDHPLEYGDFEGVIPTGEYGGGTVMLWDRGWWEPGDADPATAHAAGTLKFRLHGERLRGGFALVRMGGRSHTDGLHWLLIKQRDEFAGPPPAHETSVASGRDMAQIAAQDGPRADAAEGAVQQFRGRSRRAEHRGSDLETDTWARWAALLPGAQPGRSPREPKPQLATLVRERPNGEGWLHEIKLDGYRLLAQRQGARVRLLTRSGQDWSRRFPEIVAALERATLPDLLLDGEAVVYDREGISRFQQLQNALRDGQGGGIQYQVFDLPWCAGYDLSGVPLHARKELLETLFDSADLRPPLRYTDHLPDRGDAFYTEACRRGLEGIIAKRVDSGYHPGRSRDWLKIKCGGRQELLICGFTDPAGSREGFGALLQGWHDDSRRLRYAGKVGTGFDRRTLRELRARLESLRRKTPPVTGMPTAERRGVHWVRASLVADIEFTEWTDGGRLRHPVFRGLREDKAPAEVQREQAAEASRQRGEATAARRGSGAAGASTELASVRLTHPGRVWYPRQGLTKRDLAHFYLSVAEHLLPQVAGRPLSVLRCPRGREQHCFYQKHFEQALPAGLHPTDVGESETDARYAVLDAAAGLVGLVQLGVLELHPWGSLADRPERPDRMIFDLDPGEGVAFDAVREAALALRERLQALELESFLKTTGGKGLHLVVPLERRHPWDDVKAAAKAIAAAQARAEPGCYTIHMSKARRRGRIFIDYLRNTRGATAVAPYAVRARPGAPVATPLAWEELDALSASDVWRVENFGERLEHLAVSDPWAAMPTLRQRLRAPVLRRLGVRN